LILARIDFTNRAKVLAAAQAFEDTGVSSLQWCRLFNYHTSDLPGTIAGQIVSVEARHASYIRNLVNYGSFADNTILDSQRVWINNKPLPRYCL
jgi:hypothetical protein